MKSAFLVSVLTALGLTTAAAETPSSPPQPSQAPSASEQSSPSPQQQQQGQLSEQQTAKLSAYFEQHPPSSPPLQSSDVPNISVGSTVPDSVQLTAMPSDAMSAIGQTPSSGIQYFVLEDDIVLVNAESRQVVQILEGAAS